MITRHGPWQSATVTRTGAAYLEGSTELAQPNLPKGWIRIGYVWLCHIYAILMQYLCCDIYAASEHLPCFSIFLPRSGASQLRCSPGATCIATKRIDAHFGRRCHMDVTRIGFFMFFHGFSFFQAPVSSGFSWFSESPQLRCLPWGVCCAPNISVPRRQNSDS